MILKTVLCCFNMWTFFFAVLKLSANLTSTRFSKNKRQYFNLEKIANYKYFGVIFHGFSFDYTQDTNLFQKV